MRYLLYLFIIFLGCTAADQTSEKEAFINIKGHQIHSKTSGEGPPVIMAHGGYLNLDMWAPQIEAFRENHTLIRFSDVGHGKSKSGKGDIFGYEIIHELLERYPGEKATLIGLSWGAMLCVDYTLNHPGNVDQLILVSPGLTGWDYFQDSVARENNQLRATALKLKDTLRAARLFHQNWVIGPRRYTWDLSPDFRKSSLDMIKKTMLEHRFGDWSNLDTIPAIERLQEIEVPTYIIIGDQDAKDILMIADLYKKQIPGAQKMIIEGAAHLVNMEKPAEFNALLKSILID